jgi:serine/threonine protein kinase
MVMPLMERGTLLNTILRVKHPKTSLKIKLYYEEIKYYLCAQAALALKELLDSSNLCHKDIKADNIVMLGDNNQGCLLGLIDFANCVEADLTTTDKSGTPFYNPPEAFVDTVESFDPKKFDIFMLGCLFITIIFQSFPFVNQHNVEPKCINDYAYIYYLVYKLGDPLDFFSKWGDFAGT